MVLQALSFQNLCSVSAELPVYIGSLATTFDAFATFCDLPRIVVYR